MSKAVKRKCFISVMDCPSFKDCLVEGPSKKPVEIVNESYSTIDDALNAFNNNALYNNENEAPLLCKRYRSQMDEELDYSIIDLHDRLTKYWTQFGFLNKCDVVSFLDTVKSCVISLPSGYENEDEHDISDEDD